MKNPEEHRLRCPDCDGFLVFETGELFDGLPTGCLHCGAELIMSREWDEFDDSYKWLLVDSLEQEDR